MPRNEFDAPDTDRIQDLDRTVVTRWGGDPILLIRGFVPVVAVFLMYAADLEPRGLSGIEQMFVLQLMLHKWTANAPYPSYDRIAHRLKVSTIYARKIAKGLEERGFLVRRRRPVQTTEFDLQPLFDRLAGHVRLKERQRGNSSGDPPGGVSLS
ncbi:MAG TPA: helix-turn-helix domain-containing protein [Gemmatimonadaceae bacterium]|jgi:hypothetical protein|nr:helix-turn-helix domain-containing protein [Gemmatimonadaceae bacterium]